MKTFFHPLRTAAMAVLLAQLTSPAWAVTNTAPVVTLTGANPRTFEAAPSYTDLGATATDAEDGVKTPVITSNTVVSNVPGAYAVTWTATDSLGATGTATRVVNVVDTTPPVLAAHANVSAVATSSNGAVVTYTAGSATDNAAAAPTITYSQNSGTTFPIGDTVVTITARDASNNTSTKTFTVTVTGTGVFDFSSATPSYNPTNELALPKLVQVQINRPAPAYGPVTVKVVPSKVATPPTGFVAYTYGTQYAFTSGSSAGTVVSFADGQTSATVDVQLKSAATSQKGMFVLTLTTPTGGAALGTTTTVSTVTIKARDLTKPVVTLTTPDTSTTNVVGASVNVTGKVNENDALFSFTVKLNGVAQTLTANPLTSFAAGTDMSYSALNTAPENQTNNTLVIEALDVSGNKTTITKTLSYTNNRPELAGTYNALLAPTATPDFTNTGLVSFSVANTGLFTGTVTLGGVSVPVSGTILNSGAARFKPALANTFDLVDSSTEYDSYLGSLAFSISSPAAISGVISTKSTAGSVVAVFSGKVAPYKAVTNVIPSSSGLLNRPNTAPFTKGVYTVALRPKSQTPTVSTSLYPQGTGFATLTLTNAGDATFSGYTADGAPFTVASKLCSDNTVPLYIPLYGNRGALMGTVTFDPNQANTDVSGTNLFWVRPELTRAVYYSTGWATGIQVDLVGTKHKSSIAVDYGQGADDLTNGNSTLTFTDGLLAAPETKKVNVSSTNGLVTITPATLAGYTFALVPSNGTFSGTFKVSGENRAFKGILLSKGTNKGGYGYFLSPPPLVFGTSGQSGSVRLAP